MVLWRQVLFGLLTLLVLTMFCVASRNVPVADLARGQGTAWMRALLLTLFLFNDPLFLFRFVKPHVFLVWAASLFQIAFMCTLLLYWLVEFGTSRLLLAPCARHPAP